VLCFVFLANCWAGKSRRSPRLPGCGPRAAGRASAIRLRKRNAARADSREVWSIGKAHQSKVCRVTCSKKHGAPEAKRVYNESGYEVCRLGTQAETKAQITRDSNQLRSFLLSRFLSLHGRLREECLNVSWFQNLFDARRKIAAWRI